MSRKNGTDLLLEGLGGLVELSFQCGEKRSQLCWEGGFVALLVGSAWSRSCSARRTFSAKLRELALQSASRSDSTLRRHAASRAKRAQSSPQTAGNSGLPFMNLTTH